MKVYQIQIVQLLCLSLQICLIISVPLEIPMTLRSTNVPQLDSNETSFNSSKIISSEFKLKQDVLTLSACIGNPVICFDLVYDTASFHFWLPSSFCEKRSGCNNTQNSVARAFKKYDDPRQWLQYIMGPFGHSSTGNITLGSSDKDVNMTFVVADTIDYDVEGADGVIGFGRDYVSDAHSHLHSEKNFSILEVLKENGVINRKVFSQKFNFYDKTEATLFIGDLHEDFVNKTNVSTCKVITKDPWFTKNKVADKWTCRLSHVILGDNKAVNFDKYAVPIYSSAVFDSSTNFILAPQSEIAPFKKYLSTTMNCITKRVLSKGITSFVCDDIDKKDNVEISLVFNGAAFYIPPEYLFQPTSYNSKSAIANIFFMENLDHWVIGQSFMKNLHILFDGEKDNVSFSPLDDCFVSDVSTRTTDADFVLRDHYGFIMMLMFVFVAFMFVGLVLFLLKLKKTRSQSRSVDISKCNYALMETPKV